MLDFVKRAFRKCYEIGLWVSLALCVISGGGFGYSIGRVRGMFSDYGIVWIIGGIVVGLTAGAIVGILMNIYFGGLIATFLEIGDNISSIKAANARIEADVANIKGSAAATADVFQKMANRGAGGKA